MVVNFNQNAVPNAQNPTLMPNVDQAVSHATGTVLQNPFKFLQSNPRAAALCAVTLSTNPTDGDVLTLTLSNPVLNGGSLAVSVTAASDTTTTAAAKLAAALTSNIAAMGRQIFGTSLANVVTVNQMGPVGNSTEVAFSSTGSTTAAYSNQNADTVTVGGSVEARVWTVALTGSATQSNVNSLEFTAASLAGNPVSVTYTTAMSDTLTLVATGLKNAINANSVLSGAGITATSSGQSITVNVPAVLNAVLSNNSAGGNTELYVPSQAAGKTLVLRFTNADFSGGHEDVSHLVVNGDTLASIAAALNAGINADSVLQEAGISSSLAGLVLTINQVGPDFATLSNASSGSPSETLTIAEPSGILAGGTGPVIPFLNFNSTQNSVQLRFRQGQPVKLSIEKVAILCQTGSPLL